MMERSVLPVTPYLTRIKISNQRGKKEMN